jgi:hypothetical protein
MLPDDEATPASAQGILQCLRLLAEEAATLNLRRTLWAIQDALETVADESTSDSRPFEAEQTLH